MKGRSYRSSRGQPYTRHEYIHGSPQLKVSKFIMGDSKSSFEYSISLISLSNMQLRHNALEAARISANKVLFDALGETGYILKVCVYPHIILRENKMIATAGADRLQEGMRRAFGKPIGRAARVKIGQPVLSISVNETNLNVAKKALSTASRKLGIQTNIVIEKLAAPIQPA